MNREDEKINVYGARVHNLKNIDVEIPRNSLTVITGLSGSGKSSLAFDTIFAEGQRRYIETFSAYARNFLGGMERPDVDKITGLSPVISIEQKTTNKNPRSTVGTTTEIYDYLRLLFARAGRAYSFATGEEMVRYTEERVLDMITHDREVWDRAAKDEIGQRAWFDAHKKDYAWSEPRYKGIAGRPRRRCRRCTSRRPSRPRRSST